MIKLLKKNLVARKLKKLAKVVSSKTDLAQELSDKVSPKREALDEYLYTCIEQDEITHLLIEFNLNKDDLEKVYGELLLIDLGQWINGNYPALATLSDYDALGFYLVARNSGLKQSSIGETLLGYWQKKITKIELRELYNKSLKQDK
jgi:hypothetical protein